MTGFELVELSLKLTDVTQNKCSIIKFSNSCLRLPQIFLLRSVIPNPTRYNVPF